MPKGKNPEWLKGSPEPGQDSTLAEMGEEVTEGAKKPLSGPMPESPRRFTQDNEGIKSDSDDEDSEVAPIFPNLKPGEFEEDPEDKEQE